MPKQLWGGGGAEVLMMEEMKVKESWRVEGGKEDEAGYWGGGGDYCVSVIAFRP